jgi:hypothetical protein
MNTAFDDHPKEPIPVYVDMAGFDPVWITVTTEDAYAAERGSLQSSNEKGQEDTTCLQGE